MSEHERFTDRALREFRNDFDKFHKQFDEYQKQVNHIEKVSEKNAESVEELKSQTEEIVQLYRDAKTAVKIGVAMQRFMLWVTKWGAIGAALGAAWQWYNKHFH